MVRKILTGRFCCDYPEQEPLSYRYNTLHLHGVITSRAKLEYGFVK